MINIPNEDDYVSSYTAPENNSIVNFKIINTKTNQVETDVSYHICCPMTNEEIYNYCNIRIPSNLRSKVMLGVKNYDNSKYSNTKLPKLSIWKLDWICRNISERKLVTLRLPAQNVDSKTCISIDPYNEKEVKGLIKTLQDLAE